MQRVSGAAAAFGRFAAIVALTYLGLLAVTFFIGRVIPVDPVLAIVGDRAPEHVIARVREEMGLNKPLWQQFGLYVSKALQGEFGTSVLTANPVWSDIKKTFPATLELATAGILIGAGLGIPLGVWAAMRQGGWVDHAVRVQPVDPRLDGGVRCWCHRSLRRSALRINMRHRSTASMRGQSAFLHDRQTSFA